MSLTFDEKISILNSYSKLGKRLIKPDKINYYYNFTKGRRKTVVGELSNIMMKQILKTEVF